MEMEDVEGFTQLLTPFWKRYVDDTCTAVPVDKTEDLHKHLNSIEHCIQLTVEVESVCILLFLDIQLQHGVNQRVMRVKAEIYVHVSKFPECIGGHHPLLHKVALVQT